MADSSSSATGGLLVILGIVVVLAIGIFLMKGDMFGRTSGPSINIEAPKVEVPTPSAP